MPQEFSGNKLLQNKTFTNEITTYRFTRLPLGLACILFLLYAATRELASKHMKDFSTAAPMLDKNVYMDDFWASVETQPQTSHYIEKSQT
ncbi:hypothetical protein TNCV_5019861 [Trichonephila clavipes]|nr:hypothetical protein TNCV_5019861 [Trichonephila clavipes]